MLIARFWITLLALVVVVGLLTVPTRLAFAHDGQPPAPHDIWHAWNGDLLIWFSLALGAWAYGRGLAVLWRRLGVRHTVLGWRLASFVAGLIVLFVALISPLHALGSALFSAHMLQHMLLILVAAPLLSLGTPHGPLLLAIPWTLRHQLGQAWRKAIWLQVAWRTLKPPVVVWGLHALTLWAWHLPDLYQATLQNEWVHILEHMNFLGSAVLFWSVLLRLGPGLGVLSVFALAMQSTLLGALMTFAPRPWYAAYTATTPAWNLTPLEDQQLAGVIMWIPAGVVYTLAALIFFWAWLASAERAASQHKEPIAR